MSSGGAVMMLTTPPDRVRPVQRRARAAQHFDAVDGIERHGDIHVVVAGLRVAQALAVEQHQRLAESAAADREIGLYAIGRAFLQVERGVQRSRSASVLSSRSLARAGSTVMARSISSSESGSKVPVTTTVSCRTAGACWANAGKARKSNQSSEERNYPLYATAGDSPFASFSRENGPDRIGVRIIHNVI